MKLRMTRGENLLDACWIATMVLENASAITVINDPAIDDRSERAALAVPPKS